MSEALAKGLLSRQRRLHFIGVGGAGMSGIAELSLRLGFAVSGCDQRLGPTTERLAALGVQISQGHHPEHVADYIAEHIADHVADHITQRLDAVVISSAVKFSNPEVARARALQIPVIARAEMLGELLRMVRLGVAVAGTHGKTTTTSLVGLILEEAGLDPTVAVGGNLRARGTNVRLGGGDYMVAEADESDASFLLLLPTIAVVTNIDPEHLDHYGTMERVREAYLNFINRVPFYGLAVLGIDSINVRGLLSSVRKPVLTYGAAHDAELRAENIVIDGLSTHLLDDYAHHPAEVRATLGAARAAFKRRVVVVFQPHRYTRLRDLFDEFLGAFDDADVLYLCDVYSGGEEPLAEVSARRLYEALRARGHLEVRYLGDEPDPVGRIAADTMAGDLLVTLGAGDVYQLGEAVLQNLGYATKTHEPA